MELIALYIKGELSSVDAEIKQVLEHTVIYTLSIVFFFLNIFQEFLLFLWEYFTKTFAFKLILQVCTFIWFELIYVIKEVIFKFNSLF